MHTKSEHRATNTDERWTKKQGAYQDILGNLQTEFQNKQNQYFPIQNAEHTAKNSILWHPLANVHRYSVGILYANHFLFVHGFKMQNGSSNRSFEILLEFVRSLWPANVFCWRKKINDWYFVKWWNLYNLWHRIYAIFGFGRSVCQIACN